MTTDILQCLAVLRRSEGVEREARRILRKFRRNEDAMAKHNLSKGSSETDEPWKLPGQASQQPEQKPPPRREREDKDNKTA